MSQSMKIQFAALDIDAETPGCSAQGGGKPEAASQRQTLVIFIGQDLHSARRRCS